MKIKEVPTLEGERSVLEATKEMVSKNSSCVIVKNKNSEGIVTERDIIKKVIAPEKNPKDVKLKEVMTSPLIYVSEEDFLFDVILLMAKNNIRRVVVKRDGNILGVIEDKDIIAFESQNLVVIVKEIDKAKDIKELSYLYGLVDDMVVNLSREGVKADYISRIISEINDKFIAKAVKIAIREIGLEPPVPYSFLVLGSEGRKEQTLKTDQDNALIYDDTYPLLEVNVEEYFLNFGRKLSEILIKIGFPPCPAGVMVKNPQWNKGISQWKKVLQDWIIRPEPENTLKGGIFFDFRNAFGDRTLEDELREYVFKLVERGDLFIAYMLRDAVRFKPPLGFFGRFKPEDEKGIDLKKGGIFPITHGVRALSLKNKIKSTNTLERMKQLYEKGVIYKELYEDLKEAFTFLQEIRLKSQIEKLKERETPDNYVNPEKLPKLERDLLKDAFKVVKEFQSFIENRFLKYLPS